MSDRTQTRYAGGDEAWEDLVTPYVLDQLSPDEKNAFESFMQESDICRLRVYEEQKIVDFLRSAPTVSISHDIRDGIMDSIRAGNREVKLPSRRVWAVPLKIAAAFVIMLGALVVLVMQHSSSSSPAEIAITHSIEEPPQSVMETASHESVATPRESAVARASAWLASIQEAHGGWEAVKWGGQDRYRIGLSGLALWALVQGDEDADSDRYAENVRRGVRYLAGSQQPDGLFGRPMRSSMYNHALATVALLDAYEQSPNEDLRVVLERAVDYIVEAQDVSGGWAYGDSRGFSVNTAISIWPLIALERAASQGFRGADNAHHRGLAWLRERKGGDGRIGYSVAADFPYGPHTLTAMAAYCLSGSAGVGDMVSQLRDLVVADSKDALQHPNGSIDYYQWFFLSKNLVEAESDRTHTLLQDLQASLLQAQSHSGENEGTWATSDRWSSAGGRIYTTAMAMLTLLVDTPPHTPPSA